GLLILSWRHLALKRSGIHCRNELKSQFRLQLRKSQDEAPLCARLDLDKECPQFSLRRRQRPLGHQAIQKAVYVRCARSWSVRGWDNGLYHFAEQRQFPYAEE